jgi:LytS/YehU family sensor histidine kinase
VELIDDKPKTAKDIYKLSELLRFVTYESQEDFIELKNEIKFLEDYIYFYYKRFENELFIDFNLNGTIGLQKIPSLILIHFVENVFKHGIINDKKNPAKISISITDNHLELRTENKFLASEKYTSKGIGKTNIKRRLTALFNSDFDLVYKDKNDYFSAYLKIPV